MASNVDFGAKISSTLNAGFEAMAVSVAVRLNLFDVIADSAQEEEFAMTAFEIASKLDKKERYIRELLHALARAQFIDVDETGKKFWIASDKAKHLKSDSATQINYFKLLTELSSVDDELMQCFNKKGPNGIPYSSYTTFHETMDLLHNAFYQKSLIRDLVPLLPNGDQMLDHGMQVLDIGCGAGSTMNILANNYTKSEFTGIDFSTEAILMANENVSDCKNLTFREMDATKLDPTWNSKYDIVFAFDTIHDQSRPDLVLSEIKRVLKPGGYLYILDISSHSNVRDNIKDGSLGSSMMYVCSLYHCMPVSLYFKGGMGLGTCWGVEIACQMLKDAGFINEPETHLKLPSMPGQMVIIMKN